MKNSKLEDAERFGPLCIEDGVWSNWETLLHCDAKIIRARSLEHLRYVIEYARQNGKTIRISGGGEPARNSGSYSGSPIVINANQVIVHLSQMNSGWVDEAKGRVTAMSGMTLAALDRLALDHGLCLATSPVPKFIQVGGAVALSCHGSGKATGTISDQIVEMEILLADGSLKSFSRERNEDEFRAAIVNLGALGIIHTVTLQCIPKYKLRATDETVPMGQVIDDIEKLVSRHDYVELLWFPFTNHVWVKKWDRVSWDTPDTPPRRGSTRREAIAIGVSNLLTEFAIQFPRFTPPVCNLLSRVPTGTVVAPAPDIFHYATVFPRTLYDLSYAIECGPGYEKFKSAWNFCVEAVASAAGIKSTHFSPFSFDYPSNGRFPQNSLLHARFLKSSDGWLAPALGFEETCMFEAITYAGTPDFENYYRYVEQHWRSLGGRPHWAKTFDINSDFPSIYGENLERFNSIRQRLDPEGIFLNDFLRHVFGAGEKQSTN